MTIWKFQVDPFEPAAIEMPVFGEIVHAQMQNQMPHFWAIVDSNASKTKRIFQIIGTGHDIPRNSKYLRSFEDGQFMWHLFEIID